MNLISLSNGLIFYSDWISLFLFMRTWYFNEILTVVTWHSATTITVVCRKNVKCLSVRNVKLIVNTIGTVAVPTIFFYFYFFFLLNNIVQIANTCSRVNDAVFFIWYLKYNILILWRFTGRMERYRGQESTRGDVGRSAMYAYSVYNTLYYFYMFW